MQTGKDDQDKMSNGEVAPACAPCGEIDFSGLNGVNIDECNSELLDAESFADCSLICETIAFQNVGRGRRSGSKSTDVDVKENCRCLCRSLKLAGQCPGKLS